MTKNGLIVFALLMTTGCKEHSTPKAASVLQSSKPAVLQMPSSTSTSPSVWRPVLTGLPYQLSLKNGIFGFCDNTGPHQVSMATGQQTAGTQTCDRKHEIIQSNCDDEVYIVGEPNGGYDIVSFNQFSHKLNGHSRACDRDGNIAIIATGGDIEVIDGAANKIAVIEAMAPDNVVIGSGWLAWASLDEKIPLQLVTVAKVMEHATTPSE